MRPHALQQLGECAAVARLFGIDEGDPVGVDVLAEERHLEHTLIDERGDLGEHVAGPPVDLFAAQCGHDAERAGVVAADGYRHPCGIGGLARRGQGGRKLLEGLDDFHLGGLVVAGTVEQRRQRPDVVGAEHDVHPWRPPQHRVAVLLRQTSADGDLHIGVGLLARSQMADVSVQLVVGVLAHRAGVEHDDVGVGTVGRLAVPGSLQQPRQPLGVVHIHLAAIGADLIGARHLANSTACFRRALARGGNSPRLSRHHRSHGTMVRTGQRCDLSGFTSSGHAGRSLGKVCTHGTHRVRCERGRSDSHRRADGVDGGRQQALRQPACAQGHQSEGGPRAGHRRAGAVRFGQVDVVPRDQSAGAHRLRNDRDRRGGAAPRGQEASATAVRRGHGVPVVQPVRAQDNPGQRDAGTDEGAQEIQDRGSRNAR